MAGILSEETKQKIHQAMHHYPQPRSAAKAALRLAQEQLGWLSPEAVAEVAAEMDLDPNALHQLSTFYDMFYTQPVGRYVLGVCDNLSCCLRGSDRLLEHLQHRLKISPGETTPDGIFTLKTVDCLAACGNAPVMMVNEEYHEKLTLEAVDRLLEELRRRAAAEKGRGSGETGRRGDEDAKNSEATAQNPELYSQHSGLRAQDSGEEQQ